MRKLMRKRSTAGAAGCRRPRIAESHVWHAWVCCQSNSFAASTQVFAPLRAHGLDTPIHPSDAPTTLKYLAASVQIEH